MRGVWQWLEVLGAWQFDTLLPVCIHFWLSTWCHSFGSVTQADMAEKAYRCPLYRFNGTTTALRQFLTALLLPPA